jgi:hypothetical protein
MHLHPTETPIMLEGAIVPVGYKVKTDDFEFTAIYDTDGTVNVYVEWGDDQSGDMASHGSMSEAKGHLEMLLKVTEQKVAPVATVNMLEMVNNSVDDAMVKVQMPRTIENRIKVLGSMHATLVKEGLAWDEDRLIAQTIEEEIVRLQDEAL